MTQTVTDVRNCVHGLALALGVHTVHLGAEYSTNVTWEERAAGDIELETWRPGDRYGTRYRLYVYRDSGYGLARYEYFGGYTCGAAHFSDMLQFARKALELNATLARDAARAVEMAAAR